MRILLISLLIFIVSFPAPAQQDYQVIIDREVPEDSVPDPIAGGGSYPYGLTTDGRRLIYIDYDTSDVFAVEGDSVLKLCTADVSYPRGLYFFENQYYLLSRGRLHLLDIATGQTGIVQDVRLTKGSRPTGIAVDKSYIFISDNFDKEIRIYRRSDSTIEKTIPVQGSLKELLILDGILWLLDSNEELVYGFDPVSGEKIASFFAPDASNPRGMTVLGGYWWFTDKTTNTIIPTLVEFLPNAIRSNPRLATISFNDKVENQYPIALNRLACRMAVPFSTLRQEIYQLKMVRPDRISSDMYGQKIAFYEFSSVEAGGVREIGYRAVVRLWDIRYKVPDLSMDDLHSLDDGFLALYTSDHGKLCQSDPLIKRALKEITVEENSVITTLRNIRDYIHDHLVYISDGKNDPAPEVLSRGSGSCAEYSFVFIYMARALGIPCRFGGGSSGKHADERDVYVDKRFHRWVEVFFPAFGWVPIDANKDDSEDGEYSIRHFLSNDWKVFQYSSRFLDDGEFLLNSVSVYHAYMIKTKAEVDGRIDTNKWAEWQLIPGCY